MDKIEKIKEWVKKQKKEELARNSIGVITGKALFVDANELLSFLDTLSEEDALPCWKKVHTYTGKLREGDMEKMLLDLSVGKGKRKTKIALPDRVVDAIEKDPDKSLEEAAENYIAPIENDKGLDYINFNGRDIKDAFIAGAEWKEDEK